MKQGSILPTFQTREYFAAESVAIRDRYQQYLYIKHNAYPIDIYVSNSTNDLVMVFDKEATKDLYKLYREYKLT